MNKNITVLVYTAPYRYIKNYYSSLRSKCYTSFLRLSTLPLNTNQLKTNVGFTPPKPIQMPRGLDRMSRARNTIAYIDRIRMWVQLTRWHNYNLRRTVYILLLLMWLGNGENKQEKRGIVFGKRKGPEELTSLTFNDELFEGSPFLVGFVYPDHICEPCKVIREMFLDAANTLDTREALMKDRDVSNKLNRKGKKVKVRTIDCMKDRALCRRFRISGYPSIAFFDVIERWPLALAPGAGLLFRRMFFWDKGMVSHDMLVDFALDGYREVDPLPWFAGPFGPAGQIKGLFIRVGAAAHTAGGHLLDKGYPSWFIAATMIFAGGITTFCIILFTHMFSSKAMHD